MKQKDILFLAISSFALIVLWIIFNVYHNVVTSTISQSLIVQIAPIKPDFDIKTIENLKQRKQVTPVYSDAFATRSATVNTPTIPISTQSALTQINSTQSAATSGGTLNE